MDDKHTPGPRAPVTYVEGPLGYAIVRDGVVIGKIRDCRPRGWLLILKGHKFPPRPGSVAARYHMPATGMVAVDTLDEARRLVAKCLKEGAAIAKAEGR